MPIPSRRGATLLAFAALAACAAFQTDDAHAQSAAEPATTLPTIPVRARAETDKDSVRATTTTIGKGVQALRDVPQSITVVTERLLDDRHLDTMKDALRTTAGISFQAAEGQEEDIRLRGFALQSTGDIFLDGMRDPGFYERDSFNWDRLEVLRGSASMLFGRGSTGGAVNQVNKQPKLLTEHELELTLGTGRFWRVVGDFNLKTGDDAALRVNAMLNEADGHGVGIRKRGIAPTYRWGIGTRNEFSVGLYHLDYHNGISYGLPWLDQRMSSAFKPDAYYGAASDYRAGGTTYGTLSHTHRFADRSELRSVLRVGRYERDQRASPIRFCQPNAAGTPNVNCPDAPRVTPDNIGPGTILTRGANSKIQHMDGLYLQADYSTRWSGLGLQHEVLGGVDLAVEDFTRRAAVLPPGVSITKPVTTIGTPNDGAWVDESLRIKRRSQQFDARSVGLYAQDLIQVAPAWKLLAGARWDHFKGDYTTYATSDNANTGAQTGDVTAERGRTDSVWSKRVGLLYQPSPAQSWHLSYGTSFNTSGDTYSFDPLGSNTPPEKSRNIELGGSQDWADGRFTSRFALFHTTKYNERNRDEDSVSPTNYVLSGKRHAAGIEIDLAGRLTPAWEVFAAWSWIPRARVDRGASDGSTLIQGETVGARPAMTPRHSGSVWTSYAVAPQWRIGGGVNVRSRVKPLLSNFEAPGFVTADLMVEYTTGAARWKLHVANVTDKLYAEELYRGHWIAGKGRAVRLTMTTAFH